jgi:predicted MFS family arabinose efflux permease
MRLANANAGLWALGDGLVSSTLVIYLASDLGARGLMISLVLAAPRFAGLLRLGVPAMVARWQRRKELCITAFLASTVVLLIIPIVAQPGLLGGDHPAMVALIAAWCAHNLLEYVSWVAFWSWLGDLTPRRIRGRLLGQRQRWLVVGRIGGITASVLLTIVWRQLLPDVRRWEPLALSATAGAILLMVAAVPLLLMPAVQGSASARPRAPWRTLVRALVDRSYRRLIAYNCWHAVVTGITASAQEIYPILVLGIPYDGMLTMRGMMYAGQGAIAPGMGRLVDCWGSRPVMIIVQLLVATGPLFYLAATPERPWLLVGAFVVWIAYAGMNVGLDTLKLKLAPEDNNAPYLAVYQTAGDLANGVAIVAGGTLLDRLLAGGADATTLYTWIFLAGWIGRTLAAVLLARLVEPGARRLTDLARGR